MKKRLVILISNAGIGTNLQAIIDAIRSKKLFNAEIAAVISGSPDAYGLIRAKKYHLPTFIIPKKNSGETIIKSFNPDYIVLVGWKKIIPDSLINDFANKIINIHPGLIPETIDGKVTAPDGSTALWNRGIMTKKAIQNYFDHKATYAGSSVHFLSHEFDFGPVLENTFEKIRKNDTTETLYQRLKKKEHQILIKALQKLCNEETKKSVLIIGSGGREHAIGWKLKQSPNIDKLFFAPGNPGTSEIGENIDLKPTQIRELIKVVKMNKIGLTVVGPETPLSEGIVDEFEKHNLKIFGPTQKAAQLESSKAWATKFMQKYHIPHPQSFEFSDPQRALEFIRSVKFPVVIKTDGLAAGKGVIVPTTTESALEAVNLIMIKKEFGSSGNKIVIQEKIEGPEVSILAFSDGTTIIPLLPAQDHKRVYDNDEGPNTGGMGTYAPVPFITPPLLKRIQNEILQPTIEGMKKEGIPYKGVLYAGLMITKLGPKVIEFNARFGDPETQPLMVLLDNDLYELIFACINGNLDQHKIKFKIGAAICVVLTAKGYPAEYEKGQIIHGLNKPNRKDVKIFHAGTAIKDGKIVSAGGRVLGITAYGKTFNEARKKAYAIVGPKGVYFANMQYRSDIGTKTLNG